MFFGADIFFAQRGVFDFCAVFVLFLLELEWQWHGVLVAPFFVADVFWGALHYGAYEEVFWDSFTFLDGGNFLICVEWASALVHALPAVVEPVLWWVV